MERLQQDCKHVLQVHGAMKEAHTLAVMADMVLAECEKLRAELRYTHEKVTSSQKLDLNLERGRIRDDLTAQDNKMAAAEARLDREMAAMRTTIEAAKNDVIKYAVGTIMSFGALSLGLMRLLG